MRTTSFFVSLATAAFFCSASTVAQAGAGHAADHSHVPGPSVKVGASEVNGNVSVVMGLDGFAGGNVGVLTGPDGLLIVDNFMPGFQHKLEHALNTLKTCSDCGDLKYLINTHWHFDHSGNNDHFGDNAVLITHETVRPLYQKQHDYPEMKMVVPKKTRAGMPDITIAQKATIYFNGEEIELMHYPKSHTSGDVAVYFKGSNVVHLGDLYFNGTFPYVDLDNGGNVLGMTATIEAALEHYPADAKVIPGHGPVSGMVELKAYLDMLKETTEIVRDAKNAGMSLEEVQKKGLDERWSSWSWVFISTDAWIAQVYNSL
ncbi:MAG: MBL fold metallo-hydrolase [Magnetovibrio sp.]|nr:MBL fold metallo-hydrolase [Magnetovibrio sp.]